MKDCFFCGGPVTVGVREGEGGYESVERRDAVHWSGGMRLVAQVQCRDCGASGPVVVVEEAVSEADFDAISNEAVKLFDARSSARENLDASDAKRFRWLLAGNGYFMEEEMLCGHGPCSEEEKNEARQKIDEAMIERHCK